MFEKINAFLEKNKAIILASVLFNAFFLVVVVFFLNAFFGISFLGNSGGMIKGAAGEIFVAQNAEEKQTVEVVAKANPAVVSVIAMSDQPMINPEQLRFFDFFSPYLDLDLNLPSQNNKRQVGAGSGFFVSEDGLIVTNKHVVDNETFEYSVVTSEGESFPATVIAKDAIYDVAILKIDVANAPFLEFGNSDEIALGESVIAIGNALAEFSNSITKGVVSGLSRSVVAHGQVGQTEFLENVIQTDAGINPGNSGGPLLSLSGKVIGVNVAVAVDSENIGFALPANLVQRIVQSVKEEGRIVRPYIGVRYVILNEQVAEGENLSVKEGALIVSGAPNQPAIVPNSPAEKAGLMAGDVILEFNGKKLSERMSLLQVTREADVGDTVELIILRDGQEQSVILTLEEAPADLR